MIEVNAIRAALGWPLFATWNAWVFARNQPCGFSKFRTFLSFLPFLLITASIWYLIWAGLFGLAATAAALLAS